MRPATISILLCALIASTYGQSSIGGTVAPEGRYPYMAALRVKDNFLCGASIINERWLLTAAHCAVTVKKSQYVTAVVGTNSWKGVGGTVYRIGKVVQHEDYNKKFIHADDIAVLQVNGTINFSKTVQPVKLPKDNSNSYVGAKAIISGWGKLTVQQQPPVQLQHARLRVITNANCSAQWKSARDRDIADTQLCTTGFTEENLVTSGDSGGPLVSDGVQIGLVSFAWDELPDVFTRVSAYLSWINKQISAEKFETSTFRVYSV